AHDADLRRRATADRREEGPAAVALTRVLAAACDPGAKHVVGHHLAEQLVAGPTVFEGDEGNRDLKERIARSAPSPRGPPTDDRNRRPRGLERCPLLAGRETRLWTLCRLRQAKKRHVVVRRRFVVALVADRLAHRDPLARVRVDDGPTEDDGG